MPFRLCVCHSCGGVVVDGVGPPVVGECRLCRAMEDAVRANERRRKLREVDAKRTAGFGPAPEGVDIFAGHRED